VQLPAKEAGLAHALPNMSNTQFALSYARTICDSIVRNHDSGETVETAWQRLEVAIEDNFRCNKTLARTPGRALRGGPRYDLHELGPSPSVIQVIK
jgi:hypothetical protein